MKEAEKFSILVVDDEPSILGLFTRLFGKTCSVSVALGGDDAVSLATSRKYDLAFVDVRLSDEDGVDIIKKIKKANPQTVAVMMTAYDVGEKLSTAFEKGADEFVKKPFPSINTILTIKEAAQYLKMDKITVYKLVQRNEIPAIRLGKQWRLRREKIEEWMKEKEVARGIK